MPFQPQARSKNPAAKMVSVHLFIVSSGISPSNVMSRSLCLSRLRHCVLLPTSLMEALYIRFKFCGRIPFSSRALGLPEGNTST